jgi:hypothetical protein
MQTLQSAYISSKFPFPETNARFPRVSLPALKIVNGSFTILSAASTGINCSVFDADHANGIIKGNYTCNGYRTTGSSGNRNDTGSSQPRLKLGAKIGIGIGSLVVGLVLGAGVILFVMR